MRTHSLLRLASLLLVTLLLTVFACSKSDKSLNEVQSSPDSRLAHSRTAKSPTAIAEGITPNTVYNSIRDIIIAYARPPQWEIVASTIPDSVNIINMNMEVAGYLQQRYPCIGYVNSAYTMEADFIFVAFAYAVMEEEGTLCGGPGNYRMPTWLHCMIDVVAGYFDVRSMINGLRSHDIETVWRAVKSGIKKYVSWFAAAVLIYDIVTECI